MSQLKRMSVQGIRSFDPEKAQVIKFCPLTLILGVNGAGKTTIIEALRYITSGEAPPGTNNGRTWVHDPRLQSHIRAQVKLEFIANDGESCTASRSIEMTSKRDRNGKVTTTMKTLDMVINRGENPKAILSSKHGETGREMLSLIGVSKAVITNVIFCHQEENCWPLSEAKILKEKFDQIFGSMGYVKSLEKIKKYRADKMKEIGTLKAQLKMYEEIKDNKNKLQSAVEASKSELENLKKIRTSIEEKLKPISSELRALAMEESQFLEVRNNIAKTSGILSEKVKTQKSLEKSIREKFEGTLEDLQLKIEEFNDGLYSKKKDHEKAQKELKENSFLIKELNAKINLSSSKMGKLELQRENKQKSIDARDKYVETLMQKLSINPAGGGDESQCDHVLAQLSLKKEELKLNYTKKSKELEEVVLTLEKSIEDLKLKKAKDSQTIKLKEETQAVREKEVQELLEQLKKVETSAESVASHSKDIDVIVKKLQEKLGEMEELNHLETKASDLKISRLSLENGIMDFKRSYNNIIGDLAANVGDLKKSLKKYDEEIIQLQQKLREAKNERTTCTECFRTDESELRDYERKLRNLNEVVATSTPSSSFESLSQEVDDLRNKLSEASARTEQLAAQEKQLDKECSERDTVLREFQDNERLLRVAREIEELNSDLKKFEQQLTAKDFVTLERKKKELQQREKNLELQVANSKGKECMIINEIERNEKELKQRKYIDVDRQHKKAVIDFVTLDMACADLNTYYKVLDRAVSTYHVRKMQEVNSLIGHFWRITYQGDDIQTIKIDCEDSEGSTADKRKSYNYRLVMVRDGSDLDMRGRCSAGQKVLASLVIRIALAQIFACECAILTLDEPTTNLDRKNVGALAKAISGIVEDQKGKLQLVIITHDPEFLDHLNEEYSEFYWEVCKEDGYSKLVQHNISDLEK